jgi:hypothetical protein
MFLNEQKLPLHICGSCFVCFARSANIPVIHTCIKGIPELKQFIFDLT